MTDWRGEACVEKPTCDQGGDAVMTRISDQTNVRAEKVVAVELRANGQGE
jgi:hypothetical protein